MGEDVFEKICRPPTQPATVSSSLLPFYFQMLFDDDSSTPTAYFYKYLYLNHSFCREFELETGQVPGLPLRIPPQFLSGSNPAGTDNLIDSPASLMPELAALKGLDQVKIVTKLIKAVRSLIQSTLDPDANTASTLPTHLPDLAAEVYALSARVERPLHADTAASYCSLLRQCKVWRVQSIKSPIDPLLPHLNILILIAGGYFRQDEELSSMWDEEEEELMMEEGHDLDDIML